MTQRVILSERRETKDRIGIFGGTFDPVHRGHIQLAGTVLRKYRLDKIFFIPVKRSPFKKDNPRASAKDRIQMLRLALKASPRFKISDCEVKRPAPSYTIHTVKFFRKRFPSAELFLILGKDALKNFKLWRDWRGIEKECRLIVNKRYGGISSSSIRSHIAGGKNPGRGVPGAVAQYLKRKKLYTA